MNKERGIGELNQRLELWVRNYDLEVTIRCASPAEVVHVPIGLLYERYGRVSEVFASCLLNDICITVGSSHRLLGIGRALA
jgi:hypothetical protein